MKILFTALFLISTTLNAQNIYRCYVVDSVKVVDTTITSQDSIKMDYSDHTKYCFGDKKMYFQDPEISDENIDFEVDRMDFKQGGYIDVGVLHYVIEHKDSDRLVLKVLVVADGYEQTKFETFYLHKLWY